MQLRIYAASAVLCLMLKGLALPAFAFEAAILAPVGCDNAVSCGEDITVEEVKRLSVVASAIRTDCLKKHSEAPDICALESAVLGNKCGKNYWARLEDYADGNAVLEKLIELAESGKPFHGWWPGGSQIVQSSTSPANEKHLALCRVIEISGIAGPPRDCATVAIFTPEGTWLRGVDQKACTKMATPNKGGAGGIDIEFEILTKISPLVFAKTLQDLFVSHLELVPELKVFEGPPGTVSTVVLRFVASPRESKILSRGWRERFDFQVNFYKKDDKVRLEGTAHSLVSRLALGRLDQYQGPSETQLLTYARHLDAEVDAAIKSVCRNYKKEDLKTISCD